MATPAEFKIRFPEFAGEVDARIQLFIDDATLIMNSPGKWLDFYDVAQQYLTAHYLVSAQATEDLDSSITGPIVHQEVDDVVIKQAISAVSATAEDVLSTSYGKRYSQYRKMCIFPIIGV